MKIMSHKGLVIVIFLSAIFLLNCITIPELNPQVHASSSSFVRAEGKLLKYGTQTVYLRGTNFWNMLAFASIKASDGDYVWGPNGKVTDLPIQPDWYSKLASLNGNHVRFTLDFAWYNDGRNTFFTELDKQVNYARQNNLWILWDMHTTPGECYEGYQDHCGLWGSSAEKTKLINFWVDMADHYKNEPVVVGYGLLNEPLPPGPGWESTWYNMAQEIVTAIRTKDQNHLIFVMAGSGGQFDRTFGANIVYEVHDYEPGPGTHCQGNPGQYTYPGNIPTWWPGSTVNWSKASMSATNGDASVYNNIPLEWANSTNVPLYVGEWGMSRCTNGYAQYHKDKGEVYNSVGVHYANWVWNGGINHWGMYPDEGPMSSPWDATNINNFSSLWQNNVRANFSGTNPPPNPPPTTPPDGCKADYNSNGTVDLTDFQAFGQRYKQPGIQCNYDVIGGNCFLDIADFQAFGQVYKVANLCQV